jgi:predicted extracellular nuclease
VDVHAVKTYDASARAATHPSAHVQSSTGVSTQSNAAVQSSTPSSTSASVAAHSSAGNGTTSATSPHRSGAVHGAGTTVGKPKATQTSSSHGVLGEVANVAGSALPFTGYPLWLAGVAGLLLVATGLTLRRRTHTAA